MNRGRSYLTSVGLTACGLTLIAPALAQEVGGLTATFGVSQSISASDNLDLTDPAVSGGRAITGLSFGLSSVTQTSRLEFNTSGNFEFDSDDSGFTDPSVSLSYETSTQNTVLGFNLGYRESDVSTQTTALPDVGGFLLERLVVGTGDRRLGTAGLDLEIGADAPLSFVFALDYVSTDFSNTTDPDLFANDTLSLAATARMQVNSATVLSLGVTASDYDAEDTAETQRDNTSIFLNGTYAIRPDLSATTRLSYSRNETTTTTGTTDENGLGGGFAITKTLQNGTIGLDLGTNVSSDGRRDTVQLTRAVNLPRGAFSLTVGAVQNETSDIEPLVSMSYNQNFPRGLLTLGLTQQASIGADDETVINTRLQADYNEQINSSSSWGLSASLADTDAVDFEDNSRSIDVGLNYRHDLTRDWGLVANYTYSFNDDSDSDERTSNTVSLSIERSFQFRP